MDGILNFCKPASLSSARAVARVKRLLQRGTRIGHAGTLDPFATGVLLLLVGRATKQCERLMDLPKQYVAAVKLGATTPTDDPESPQTPWADPFEPVSRADVEAVLGRFIGEIDQVPPVYSAMKVKGQRAYKLARKGRPPEMRPRRVRVDHIELLEYDWPILRLRIDCGRGTYIRSLARDLGRALGVGGHISELVRTAVGPYRAEDAVRLEQLEADGVDPHLSPPDP